MAVRAFIANHKIPMPLGMAMRASLERREHLSLKHVSGSEGVLCLFSGELRHCIRVEIHSMHLQMHPVLVRYRSSILKMLCIDASRMLYPERNEIVFKAASVTNVIYIATMGSMHYRCLPRAIREPIDIPTTFSEESYDKASSRKYTEKLKDGQFVSELSLWVVWKHTGDLFSPQPSAV